mmetsp:Transcript_97072/g.118878  ORF Transcript_97072/g.118878 Transcript_97072/m.118878 type:complete len:204 (-) Transcript_97072:502-1113(-)
METDLVTKTRKILAMLGLNEITSARILGKCSARTSAVARRGAHQLDRFWDSLGGLIVRQYLVKKMGGVEVPSGFRHWHAYFNALLVEFSRFFLLKVLNETEPNVYGTHFLPSPAVDEVWRALIFFPQIYYQLCMCLTGATCEKIYHDPPETEEIYGQRYFVAFHEYTKWFGTPPPHFWPQPGSALSWEVDTSTTVDSLKSEDN